jgi:hypothetical protein
VTLSTKVDKCLVYYIFILSRSHYLHPHPYLIEAPCLVNGEHGASLITPTRARVCRLCVRWGGSTGLVSDRSARRFHPLRSILTEIYLCHTCSCHEILRMETPGQAGQPPRLRVGRGTGCAHRAGGGSDPSVFCSRCLHIPFIAWSLVSVVCAACIVPARITNAGGDHGIAPNKNWLRFAYDSIRICICDPLISTWPRASPVSMGPRRAMLRLCSAAGAGLCLASVPVFWLYHLGDISMATEILDWLRFTYYVFETDRLNDVTAQVHGVGRRRVLRAGHRGPGWAHGACDALEAAPSGWAVLGCRPAVAQRAPAQAAVWPPMVLRSSVAHRKRRQISVHPGVIIWCGRVFISGR